MLDRREQSENLRSEVKVKEGKRSAMADLSRIRVTAVEAPEGWAAVLLPIGGYPAPEKKVAPQAAVLAELARYLQEESKVVLEVFLQLTQMHLGGANELVRDNARDWLSAASVRVGATAFDHLLLVRFLAPDPAALRADVADFVTRLRSDLAGQAVALPKVWLSGPGRPP